MDYSIIFDLIWKLINMILQKEKVAESLSELGVNLYDYIKVSDEVTTTTAAQSTTGASTGTGSNAGSIVADLLGRFL